MDNALYFIKYIIGAIFLLIGILVGVPVIVLTIPTVVTFAITVGLAYLIPMSFIIVGLSLLEIKV